MKIAICSDLHLEFAPLEPNNSAGASVLVLAGDILIASDFVSENKTKQERVDIYRQYLKQACRLYEHVVCIAGNHEFYHGYWNKTLSILRGEYAQYGNIHFLENTTTQIDGYTFIGSTFWTDLNNQCPVTALAVKRSMNDYRLITYDGLDYHNIRPSETVTRHKWSRNYLTSMLDQLSDRKFIVVTHTAPTSKSIPPQYSNDTHINGAYFTDLGNFIADRPQIKLWIHGHVHTPVEYTVGETRVIANPRGYVGSERDSQDIDPYWPVVVSM